MSTPTSTSGPLKPSSDAPSNSSTGSAVLDSLVQPGLNKPMQLAMNASFAGLILVLGAMALLTKGDLHVVFVIVTTLALWGSINWFLSEIAKLPPSAKEIQQMPSSQEVTLAQGEGTGKETTEDKKDR